MNKSNFLFMVKSAEEVELILNCFIKHIPNSRISSLGLFDDSETTPCVITCTWNNPKEGREEFLATISELRSYGVTSFIG